MLKIKICMTEKPSGYGLSWHHLVKLLLLFGVPGGLKLLLRSLDTLVNAILVGF